MYDYMKALHARFCREPELQKAREELEQAYREIKARLGQQDQETLLQLADLENELREETSLTSFIAGFQLGMGIAGEIEPYCFEDEEEKRATERAKAEVSPGQKLIRYSKKKGCRWQPFLNFLITVAVSPGYFFFCGMLCRCKGGGCHGKETGQRRRQHQKKKRWPMGGPVHCRARSGDRQGHLQKRLGPDPGRGKEPS